MIPEKELQELKNKLTTLEKKDIDLIISDFDDTIFSTNEVIERNLTNWLRWNEWNQYIKEVIWIKEFIDTIYIWKDFPKHISTKLRENHDLILTAWYEEIQSEKIKACKLNHINYKVVFNSEDKIIETIKYIINNLWFIPNKITVYEDRPKYFIEYKNLLEDFFNIEVEIMYVEFKNNLNEPKITKLIN